MEPRGPLSGDGVHNTNFRLLSEAKCLDSPTTVPTPTAPQPSTGKDLHDKKISKDAMFTIMDEGKRMERKALFKAFHEAYNKFASKLEGTSQPKSDFVTIIRNLPIPVLEEKSDEHLERTIRKLCKAENITVPDAEINDLLSKLKGETSKIDKEKFLLLVDSSNLRNLSPERKERLLKDINFVIKEKNKEQFAKDYKKLKEDIIILASLIKDPNVTNTRSINLALLQLKRQALRNPAYQLLKTDESNTCVRFLHSLCLASYANTEAVTAYQHFGDKALDELKAEPNTPLCTKLRNIYEHSERGGVAASNLDVVFSRAKNFTGELGQVVHAVLSNIPVFLHLPRILQGLFPQEDQRIAYENNPGALYTETLQSHGKTVHAHTVYTPGPTVGFEGSLEFRACLQAMENRQYTPIANDDYPYRGWIYTNLQDIASTLENPQSVGTMQLNEEYPDSFWGITISQDNPLMKGVEDEEQLNTEYQGNFLKSILDPDNYTLKNRKDHPGGGYYFNVPEGLREQWKKDVEAIVAEAFEIAQGAQAEARKQGITLPNKTVHSAFRDLAHLGMMSHYQKMFVDQLAKKATGEFHILESHICRSGMDRGGQVNAQLLFASLLKEGAEPIQEDLIAGVTFARAFLSRRRLLIEENLERTADLVQAISREKAQEFMKKRHYGETSSQGIGLTHSLSGKYEDL